MDPKNVPDLIIALALTITFLVGCGAPATPPEPTLTPTPIPPTATSTPLPPEHRIGVRVVDGIGEFYDRLTGEKFIPRGNNYVRLSSRPACLNTAFYHSTFSPGEYDSVRASAAMEKMREDGYNIVRIFIDEWCVVESNGKLSDEYVDNMADFLKLAQSHGLFVIATGYPPIPGYADQIPWRADIEWPHNTILTKAGIQVDIDYWLDLVEALKNRSAPLDYIFAYELRNELSFDVNRPPLSLTTGIVETANGKTYDMTSGEDKQRMMDENLINWIDRVRAGILKVDPTALVTVSFFWPQEPHPARIGDPRVIETRPAIWESSLDYIDLHLYPGWELTLSEYVDNFKMAGMEEKPIIMGEFGAAVTSYSTTAAAARAFQDWQVESCNYGFDGWLLWTWDTWEQTDFYNGLSGQGEIDQVLAPVNRPDPCQSGTFSFLEYNLAFGKTVIASQSNEDTPASNAVNGTTSDWWGAGAFAPQWIEIDLGEPMVIGLVRLTTSQSPVGDTRHQIWAGPTRDTLVLLHTFEENTADLQVLEFIPEAPIQNVRYIRVVTTASPSWISWREIEVLAP